MVVAFGSGYDRGRAGEFFDRVRAQDVAGLPRVGLLDDRALNGARGVYVQETDTIYLSRQFVEGSSVDRITGVLIEEIGHGIDARVNAIDAVGDEGDIFSRLVRQESIGADSLKSLRVEDDHAGIIIDGRELAVEQAQDFNNDVKVDILWRNYRTGENVAWLMNETAYMGLQGIAPVADKYWDIKGTGDFNQDGQTDIVWHHRSTGQTGIWLMNGSTQIGWIDFGNVPTDWDMAGTGDIDRNGSVDLVWRNYRTGDVGSWLMNKTNKAGWASLGYVDPNLGWNLQSVGDFNQDDNCDLVWRNYGSGLVGVWLMNGASQSGWAELGNVPDLDWQIEGVADFNMDGQTDLLWRHYRTGDNGIWLMNGTTQIDWVPLTRVEDLDWEAKVSTPTFYNPTYGHGLVNAAAAVAKAIGQPTFADVTNTGIASNDMINAPEVWAKNYKGQGVVVAVVDTGVDINHPALKDNIWVNLREIPNNGKDDDRNGFIDDVNGWDFTGNTDNSPIDDAYNGGHGTHLAGIIAAKNLSPGVQGVAPNAKIMPVRVQSPGVTSLQFHTSLANGIRYAADNKAQIINLSLGTDPANGQNSSDIAIVKSAIIYAISKGSIVVSSAGNYGSSLPEFPARYATEYGIAVGVVDDNRKIHPFSNKAGANSKMKYVVAPGIEIKSTYPVGYQPGDGYSFQSGTSMSAAKVSGVIALMLSANPSLKYSQIRDILIDTASRLI
jgi:hypothetical protein